MLDFVPEGMRSAGTDVRLGGQIIAGELGPDVAPCGADEVSAAIVNNLNQRRRWLASHLRAGHGQALAGADGIEATASGYESEDAAGASRFQGATHTSAPAVSPVSSGPAAPGDRPAGQAIPDISGREGEQLAIALAGGVGTGPALAAAARCAALAAQAEQAVAVFSTAKLKLASSGQSEAHGPLLARLSNAIVWSEGIAAEATALSVGYTAAATTHTAAQESVGTPAHWRAVKTALTEAIAENQATFGAAEPRVRAIRNTLKVMQQGATVVMTGYRSTGEEFSDPPTPPVAKPELAPNGESPAAPGQPGGGKDADPAVPDDPTESAGTGKDSPAGGIGDALGPVTGILGSLTQGLGQNPLSSIGQAAGQLGQQLGKTTDAMPHASPLKPASPAVAKAGSKGLGGLGKGVGGAGIGTGAAVHPSAVTAGTPASTPASARVPGLPAAAATGAAAGAGMMPMGAHAGDRSAKPIDPYPDPLDDVPGTGRPGVVGDTTKPDPVVNPKVRQDIKKRIAERRALSGHDVPQ